MERTRLLVDDPVADSVWTFLNKSNNKDCKDKSEDLAHRTLNIGSQLIDLVEEFADSLSNATESLYEVDVTRFGTRVFAQVEEDFIGRSITVVLWIETSRTDVVESCQRRNDESLVTSYRQFVTAIFRFQTLFHEPAKQEYNS